MTITPLRIGLPKGRILKDLKKVFGRAGIDLSVLERDQRRLVQPLDIPHIGPVEVLRLRASDVAAYVEHGACAVGIAGFDTLVEEEPDVLTPLDLGVARCRMCLCGAPGLDPRNLESPRIASKYGKVARRFFLENGTPAEVIELSGAIEIAALVGLADGIVDIVQTGETLKRNGLVELETIFDISSRVVVNRAAHRLRMGPIRTLLDALSAAVQEHREQDNEEQENT